MIIAFDTETTGIDLFHGAMPFFASVCFEDGSQQWWEWSVDVRTREVKAPKADLDEILEVLTKADRIVGQNIRFDVHAMARLDSRFKQWDWTKTDDTLIAAHLLGSNQQKDLTTLAARYLKTDISKYEDDLHAAVKKARSYCKLKENEEELGWWALADEDRVDMPSSSGKVWKSDYWLPKAMYNAFQWVRDEHPDWATLLEEYCNADTAVTLAVWQVMDSEIKRLEVEGQYKSRMQILPVTWQMEEDGITVLKDELESLTEHYTEVSQENGKLCLNIAASLDYELELPKTSVNKSLSTFMFDVLDVPRIYSKKAKTDNPTLDKNAMAEYLSILPERSKSLAFVKALTKKRKVDTSLSYMESYRRYGIGVNESVFRMHPSINPVGTDVTRRSSSAPNEQNISKKKDTEGRTLRNAFGPRPGREWWSMDYENIELRIPAYEAGEQAMIDLFENPDAPPYFGSNHLFNAHILWPKEFEEWQSEKNGYSFKDKYKDTLYSWTKNGDFAVQYGAMKESGTADRAFHQKGAQEKIEKRLGKISELNKFMIDHANRYGFVYTMPDKTVDPRKGYPVMCTRTDYGKIKPTVPLSYHIQGTAGWCTGKALIRCHEQLEEWNRAAGCRDYFIVAEVHDELVFEMPAGGRKNLPKVNKLKYLMEKSGDDIGVPLTVSVSYHKHSWGKETPLE